MKVIAISGHDGAGKSTLAANLKTAIEQQGLSAVVLPLALTLKKQLEGLGFPAFDKPTAPHMRELMRAYGWARRVNDGPDYWLNLWERSAVDLKAGVVIVDDVRHLNEYDFMQLRGAHFIALNIDSVEPVFSDALPAIIKEVWAVRKAILETRGKDNGPQRFAIGEFPTPDALDTQRLTEFCEGFLRPVLDTGMDWIPSFNLASKAAPAPSVADQLAAAEAWQAGARHYAAGGAPTHNPYIFKTGVNMKITAAWQNGFAFARGADVSGGERAKLRDWAHELHGMVVDAINSPQGTVPESCQLVYDGMQRLQQDEVKP